MEYIYIIVQLMIMMMMMYMSIRLIKRSHIMSDILNRPISELPHKLEMIFFRFFFFSLCSHLNHAVPSWKSAPCDVKNGPYSSLIPLPG